jgi:type IV secretory pathway VirB10-like protein
MRSKIPITPQDSEPGKPKLSFLRLILILIAGLTVISIVMMLAIFFLSDKDKATKDVNVNITVLPATPSSAKIPVIQQAPPPALPKNIKQPTYNMPAPPTIQTPDSNAAGQLAPRRTPQPTPSESPP